MRGKYEHNKAFLSEYQKALRDFKITSKTVAKKIHEHLNAKKTVSAVSGKDANAGTVDFIEVDDYQTQQKAIEQVFKIENIGQKVDVNHTGSVSHTIEVIDYSTAVKK